MTISSTGSRTGVSNFPPGFTATTTNLALTGVSQQLLPANARRKRLIIINQSIANFINANFGAAATAAGGLRLGCLGAVANSGQHFWDSANGPCPTGTVNVIGTAGQVATAIEFAV